MSAADLVVSGGGGPAGWIAALWNAFPSYGRTVGSPQNPNVGAGSQEDPYGQWQELDPVLMPILPTDVITPQVPGVPPAVNPYVTPGPSPSLPDAAGVRQPGTYPEVYRPPQPPPRGRLPLLAEAIGMASRLGTLAGGLLYPSAIGDATVLPKGKRRPKGKKFPSRRRSARIIDPTPRVSLPGVLSQPVPRSATRSPGPSRRPTSASPGPGQRVPSPQVVVTAAPAIPTSFPYAVGMPSLPRVSSPLPKSPAPAAPRLPVKLPTLQDLLPLAFAFGQPTRATPPQPGNSPISGLVPTSSTPPISGVAPLTPQQPGVLAYSNPFPYAGGPPSGSTRTLQDQCRDLSKRRKPRRRCVKRDDCNKCVKYEAI